MLSADLTLEFGANGALASNVSAHSGDLESFVVYRDLYNDEAKRRRKRPGRGTSKGSVAGTEIQVLHEFPRDNGSGTITYNLLGAIDGGSYIYRWNGATWDAQSLPITVTAGGRWSFCNFNNRCFVVNGKDEMLVYDGTSWLEVGVNAPTAAPTYSLTTNDAPYSTGSIAATKGSVTLTGTGTTWVTGATWVGKKIDINGIRYEIAAVATTTSMTITEGFKEETATGLTYSVYRGVGDWNLGPKYAFSYYNPTTGHVSNRSPIVEVTQKNQVGRTITVTIAGAAENTSAYDDGYTEIQLYRTAADGNVLVALDEKLNNNDAGTAITYTETAAKFVDTFLTRLEAPLTVNRRPPEGITALAVWQGRLWGLKPSDSTNGPRLYWTPTLEEMEFGVAEECWPALNSRRLDGPTGLTSLGSSAGRDSLLIQTDRGDYSVRGFDNTDYTVYRLPTRETGGFQYGALGLSGDFVQFYRDKRLLVNGQDAPEADLGRWIQDKLNLVKSSIIGNSRLFRFASNDFNFLMLSVPKEAASTANDYTYVFDLDKPGRIYEWNFGITAATTIHDSGALKLWIGDDAGAVYELLPGASFQDAGADYQPTFKTTVLRPFGPNQKAELAFVQVFVSDAALTWTGNYYLNESASGTAIALVAADHRAQSADGRELQFVPHKPIAAEAWQFDGTFPADDGDLYVEKIVFGFNRVSVREAVV